MHKGAAEVPLHCTFQKPHNAADVSFSRQSIPRHVCIEWQQVGVVQVPNKGISFGESFGEH